MTARRLVGGSVVLLAANVVGGLGHYFFQVRGAARLPAAAYGALNVWIAYLALALALGTLTQISANFRPRLGAALRRAALAGLGLGVALGAAAAALVALDDPHVLLFPTAVLGGIAYLYLFGQLQAHTRFTGMGVSLLVTALVKVAVTYVSVGARPEVAYYVAFTVSTAAGCATCGLWLLGAVADEQAASDTKIPGGTASTVVLALATALLPQLDLLNLRSTHDDSVLGEFARASLFAKALYFGALTLLQVTLPFHVRMARGTAGPEVARRVRAFELFGLASCVAASIVFAWIGPPIARRVLGVALTADQRTWVVLSCLCMTALWGHVQGIQLACALGRWRTAAVRLMPLVLTLPVFAVVHLSTVTLYLQVALSWYAVLYAVFLAARGIEGRH